MSTILKIRTAAVLERRERDHLGAGHSMQVGPAPNPSTVQIHTGAVLDLRERDHLGTGNLTLKLGPVTDDLNSLPATLEWMVLVGREVRPDGLGEPRRACVRVSAIPDAMRPDDWRPAQDPEA